MSGQAKVTIYGNAMCPYCGAARMLLTKKAIEFDDVSVSDDAEKFALMQQLSGSGSVPQIFVGDTHVGGFDELYALNESGDLDNLLQQ